MSFDKSSNTRRLILQHLYLKTRTNHIQRVCSKCVSPGYPSVLVQQRVSYWCCCQRSYDGQTNKENQCEVNHTHTHHCSVIHSTHRQPRSTRDMCACMLDRYGGRWECFNHNKAHSASTAKVTQKLHAPPPQRGFQQVIPNEVRKQEEKPWRVAHTRVSCWVTFRCPLPKGGKGQFCV